MKKITEKICSAFYAGKKLKINNTKTDGRSIWLFGNMIVRRIMGDIYITTAEWNTPTTKERLRGLEGVDIKQKKGQLYLNDKKWDGNWTKI